MFNINGGQVVTKLLKGYWSCANTTCITVVAGEIRSSDDKFGNDHGAQG